MNHLLNGRIINFSPKIRFNLGWMTSRVSVWNVFLTFIETAYDIIYFNIFAKIKPCM